MRLFALLLLFSFSFAGGDFAFRINSYTLPLSDFDQQFMATLEQYKKDFLIANEADISLAELNRLKYGILDTLIDRALILDYAKTKRILIPNSLINTQYLALKKSFPTPEAFEKHLKSQGLTPRQIKESLHVQLVKDALVERVYQNSFAVTTQDILLYIRQNHIALLPVQYNLTLLVTTNKSILDTLQPADLPPFTRFNAEISSLNMFVADNDLDLAMQSILDTLKVGEYSSTAPYDDMNYFRVRINDVKTLIPPHLQHLIQDIIQAIQGNRKTEKLNEWLTNQRHRVAIHINLRAFPDFYHRTPLRDTLEAL